MKGNFTALVILFMTIFISTSCLNDDDDYVYYDDTVITSFSVSTAKHHLHLVSSTGGDSVVTTTMSLSGYKFYIDHSNREIYNPDSLPYGVDARKLICVINTLNSGSVYIKSTTSDSVMYVSGNDSLDFSVPRELQVASQSYNALRKYTVKVNVHQEDGDVFHWHSLPASDALRGMSALRMLCVGGKVMALGSDGNATHVFVNDNGVWSMATPDFNHALAADAYRGAVVKDDMLYLCDGDNIIRSANGSAWHTAGTSTGVRRLVAASRFRLFGYDAEGRMMASGDNGETWVACDIDDDKALLPDGETAYAITPLATNLLTDRVTLVGSYAEAHDNGLCVWGKIDEGGEYSQDQPWTYYNVTSDNKHVIPSLSGIGMESYDRTLMLFGMDAEGVPAFYRSSDGGITWREDTTLVVPDNFCTDEEKPLKAAYTVDGDNFIWLVNVSEGKTWKGRLNRLGWREEQKEFTE